jgi:hypothetical protein
MRFYRYVVAAAIIASNSQFPYFARGNGFELAQTLERDVRLFVELVVLLNLPITAGGKVVFFGFHLFPGDTELAGELIGMMIRAWRSASSASAFSRATRPLSWPSPPGRERFHFPCGNCGPIGNGRNIPARGRRHATVPPESPAPPTIESPPRTKEKRPHQADRLLDLIAAWMPLGLLRKERLGDLRNKLERHSRVRLRQ